MNNNLLLYNHRTAFYFWEWIEMVRESLLLSLDINLNVYSWEEKQVEELGEEEEEEETL